MRTLKTTLTALTFFFIIAFAACKKDNGSAPPPTTVTGAITPSLTEGGTWRVGAFIDNGTDKTDNYTDFKLLFSKTGYVTATGPNITFSGAWWASNDNNRLRLNLDFVNQGAFEYLTHEWTVMQQGTTQIQLSYISKDDGSVDLLTLNKNLIK